MRCAICLLSTRIENEADLINLIWQSPFFAHPANRRRRRTIPWILAWTSFIARATNRSNPLFYSIQVWSVVERYFILFRKWSDGLKLTNWLKCSISPCRRDEPFQPRLRYFTYCEHNLTHPAAQRLRCILFDLQMNWTVLCSTHIVLFSMANTLAIWWPYLLGLVQCSV